MYSPYLIYLFQFLTQASRSLISFCFLLHLHLNFIWYINLFFPILNLPPRFFPLISIFDTLLLFCSLNFHCGFFPVDFPLVSTPCIVILDSPSGFHLLFLSQAFCYLRYSSALTPTYCKLWDPCPGVYLWRVSPFMVSSSVIYF